MSSVDITDAWTNIWFAKNERQKVVDELLKRYENDLELCKSHKPQSLIEKLGMIILYDQIPRNIFRCTAKSYEYESICLPIALELAKPGEFEALPLENQLTTFICIVHSEQYEHLEVLHRLLEKICENRLLDPALKRSLLGINRNHDDRISLFGRIPERNIYLNRQNTLEEDAYLQALY